MSYLKERFNLPMVKYGALALGSRLWLFGLVDQFNSSAAAMKYILMSLLIAAVTIM